MPHLPASSSSPINIHGSYVENPSSTIIHQSYRGDRTNVTRDLIGRSQRADSSSSTASINSTRSRGSLNSPSRKHISMDPNCFVCGKPVESRCDCEHRAVTRMVEEAEKRAISRLRDDARYWVTNAARSTIQSQFRSLESRRRAQYSRQISSSPPSKPNFSQADLKLKHGTNEDWKIATDNYPQILDEWYSELGRRLACGWGLPKGEMEDDESFGTQNHRNYRNRGSYDGDYENDVSGRMMELDISGDHGRRHKSRSRDSPLSSGKSRHHESEANYVGHSRQHRGHRESNDDDHLKRRGYGY